MITKQVSRLVGTLVPLPVFYHFFIYLVFIKVPVQTIKKKTFSRRKAYQKPFFKKESFTNNFFTFGKNLD
jgi:hypothetical protein